MLDLRLIKDGLATGNIEHGFVVDQVNDLILPQAPVPVVVDGLGRDYDLHAYPLDGVVISIADIDIEKFY